MAVGNLNLLAEERMQETERAEPDEGGEKPMVVPTVVEEAMIMK